MLEFGKTTTIPASVTVDAPYDRDAEIYDRHAGALYRQALLTLGDAGLAEQVVCDVLVDECVWPPAPAADADEASCRLALAAYGRCQELDGASARQNGIPADQRSESGVSHAESSGLLSRAQRGALGLVLFGGLGYARASRELAISPADMATLLRGALQGLTASCAGAGAGCLWGLPHCAEEPHRA
jgi:DNA-directed RNA polymerase specialized sigma24 family protein